MIKELPVKIPNPKNENSGMDDQTSEMQN